MKGDDVSFRDPHAPAFVCSHVFNAERPILLVSHETDGDWQFLCGGDHGEGEKPRVIGVGHLVERDASLATLSELPPGWEAERSAPDAPWEKKPASDA